MDSIQKQELIGKLKTSIMLSEGEKQYMAEHFDVLSEEDKKELQELLLKEQKIDWEKEAKIVEAVMPKIEELEALLGGNVT